MVANRPSANETRARLTNMKAQVVMTGSVQIWSDKNLKAWLILQLLLAPVSLVYSSLPGSSVTPAGTVGQQCLLPRGTVTGPPLKYVQSVNNVDLLCPTGSLRAAKTEPVIRTQSPQSLPIQMSQPPRVRRFDLPGCH